MIGIVVVTHGKFASGLIDAARLIVGEQKFLSFVSLTEKDSVEGLKAEVEAAIAGFEDTEGTLLLVDLPGATPFNVCAQLALTNENITVVTGVNLPMLLEVSLSREMYSYAELVNLAKSSGITGIRVLPERAAE